MTNEARTAGLRFNWAVVGLYLALVVVGSVAWQFGTRWLGIEMDPALGRTAKVVASWTFAFLVAVGSPFLFKPRLRPRSWGRHVAFCALVCLGGGLVTAWLGIGH